ncbi:MAG TPA: hypothetical protein VGB81_09820 [Devosia sp.]
MNNIRLLPIVVVAVAALLLLKTLGLVTNGGYVLGGVMVAQAAGEAAPAPASEGHGGGGGEEGVIGEPTIEDTSPTLVDENPTLSPASAAAASGGHGAPAEGEQAAAERAVDGEHAAPEADHKRAEGEHPDPAADHAPTEGEHAPAATLANSTFCRESDAKIAEDGTVVLSDPPAGEGAEAEGGEHPAEAEEGEHAAAAEEGEHAAEPAAAPAAQSFAASMTDCLPSGDAVPVQIDGQGGAIPLINAEGSSLSEQQLLERLAARRTELEKYEQDLALRSSIVDAAEKRIEERTATLQALEAQISTLVDQRTEMESGQFAGIVAMYETMKPKDAAAIFNNLNMEVLLRVAKTMSPRKMAPILAVMDTARAQELTVKMAALAEQPAAEMTPDDLAALPQIVGQ